MPPFSPPAANSLKRSRSHRDALETIYSWCGWLALLMDVFGWSLSLYGSLFGDGILGEER